MQKLCCVRTRQHPLPVWSHKFVISSLTHFSINSRPFLVGIVSHVLHSLRTGLLPISLEEHRAHVVLVQHGVLDTYSLIFQKLLCPQYLGQNIIHSNNLTFGGAPHNQFLLLGTAEHRARSHGHCSPGVPTHVVMDSI